MDDLNHLYSEHQISLMRAREATCGLARTRHLASAGTFADRIRSSQIASGAAAAQGWLHAMADPGRAAGMGGALCA